MPGLKYDPTDHLGSYGSIDGDAAPGSSQVVLMATDKMIKGIDKAKKDEKGIQGCAKNQTGDMG